MSEKVDMRALLEVAKCPCCDGSGGRYDNYGNAEQCQWCYERSVAIAAPAAPVVQAEQGPVAFQCHSCKAQTPPPAPFKWYVECKECGEKTAATAAAEFTNHAAQPAQPDASVLVEALEKIIKLEPETGDPESFEALAHIHAQKCLAEIKKIAMAALAGKGGE